MKTKALLLTAALGLAGAATSMAQVYSQNAVGYVNVTCKPGFNLIANPLNATANTLSALIPSPPPGAVFYKYSNPGGYSTFIFDDIDLVWTPNGNVSLAPGEGAFLQNPAASDFVITFVGEVLQGALSTSLPLGFSIASSKVPQSADVNTLQLPAAPGDILYKYSNPGGYSTFIFDDIDNVWTPSVPVINVGEAVFLNKTAAQSWNRTFTVN